MISHKWLYLADIFEHQIMLMNNLRNFPPVTLGIFQSTLLQEERLWRCNISLPLQEFQSTLLQEERLCLFPEIFQLSSISIHAPTRGATSRTSTLSFCICISIHAPTRGATFIVVSAVPARIISIHAPTRGATILVRMFLLNYIFQSTLLQEERLIWLPNSNRCRNFNPRSYKRSDIRIHCYNRIHTISIHAPTRGATAKMHNYPYTYL